VHPEPALRDTVLDLPLLTVGGPWTRVIAYRLLQGPPPGAAPGGPPQPFWPGGPRLHGARFSPKGAFGSIYLASDPITALTEVGAVLENPSVPRTTLRTPPWTVFAVEGIVTGVLDLTDARNQERLGTSLSELTGE
jgi:RES domain-containing protein